MRTNLLTSSYRIARLHQPPSLSLPIVAPPHVRYNYLSSTITTADNPIHHRTLTTSPSRPLPSKHKDGKSASKRTVPLNVVKTASLDPFDFSDYDAAVERVRETLKAELARVKAGGRDPEVLEGVRVVLAGEKGDGSNGKGKDGGKDRGKEKGNVVRVGDVASVVRRGRNVAVVVGEKDHLRPTLSALSIHPTPLSPTPSPTDPLTILIPLPPPTATSRHEAFQLAHKKGEEALFALREARGAQRKRLRAMELGRTVGPDELRRAERDLERRCEGAVGGVKELVEAGRKALEG